LERTIGRQSKNCRQRLGIGRREPDIHIRVKAQG
jgi:hypothetical protein